MPPRPILQTLADIWQALRSLGLPIALIGGLGMSAWKHVRATQDVDLLVGVGERTADDILQHVTDLGFRPRRSPPVISLDLLRVIQLVYEPVDAFVDVPADLLLADSEYHRQASNRRVARQLPEVGFDVFVLTCEDIILHKLLAGQIIDQADIVALIAANRDSIDRKYIDTWANRLNLIDDWQKLLATADG